MRKVRKIQYLVLSTADCDRRGEIVGIPLGAHLSPIIHIPVICVHSCLVYLLAHHYASHINKASGDEVRGMCAQYLREK